jgi:hypothetical protein
MPDDPPRRIEMSWKTLILQKDQDWVKDEAEVVEFIFSNGREFKGRYRERGPYADD